METVGLYYLNINALRGKEDFLYKTLPKVRVEKAKRFLREEDRLMSLAAGYLSLRFVGETFIDEYGKPGSEKLFFSLSHSGGVAAIAISKRCEVGVDIEKISADKDADKLAKFCLSDGELEEYSKGTDFLTLFTAKESLSKAEGRGLGGDIKKIPALPVDGRVEYKGKTYYRHSFFIGDCRASISSEGEDFAVEVMEIESI